MQLFSLLTALLVVAINGKSEISSSCDQAPKHIHLAVGPDSSTTMTVTFATSPCIRFFDLPMENQPTGAVLFGTRPDRLDRTVVAQSKPFRDNFLQFPHNDGTPKGNYTSDYYHHVHLDGLEPNQKYYYRCIVLNGNAMLSGGDSEQEDIQQAGGGFMRATRKFVPNSESKPKSFWTAPSPGKSIEQGKSENGGSLKLAILGDLGYAQKGKDTIATLSRQRDEINAVILAGDIAYPKSDPAGWDYWFDAMDEFPAFSELPIQVAAGNHDIEPRRNGDVFMEYENRFYMPKIKESEMRPHNFTEPGKFPPLNLDAVPYPLDYDYGNSFYSFIYGITHNIVINAYADFDPGSNQYRWLVSELESVDRNLTPWLFVTLHVPIYNTYHDHHKDIQHLKAKEHLEHLCVNYGVNIVFAGHIHAYQRTHPVINEKVNPKGPIHIIVGDGGRMAGASFMHEEPEEWVAARDATNYGYGTIEVFNGTHAKWDWVHSVRGESVNHLWHPRPRGNRTYQEVTFPPVEHDSAFIQNQYFL